MIILNLTQHVATAEQVVSGVVEPEAGTKKRIVELLTFSSLPTVKEISDRAQDLAILASVYDIIDDDVHPDAVMIGGAPFLMGPLEQWCAAHGLKVLYAFSERESVDVVQEDGSTIKTSTFVHKGFVEAY